MYFFARNVVFTVTFPAHDTPGNFTFFSYVHFPFTTRKWKGKCLGNDTTCGGDVGCLVTSFEPLFGITGNTSSMMDNFFFFQNAR